MVERPTHYMSSKGPILIADMPHPYLRNAVAKMEREGRDNEAAFYVMAQRLAELDAAEAAQAAAEPGPAEAVPGHNRPPEPTTFEAIKAKIDDLFDEAKNWLDGQPIQNQAQADEVYRLRRMILEAEAQADTLRKVENEPFDTGKAEVQARYAPLIADTKAVRGKTVVASQACLAALQPWLLKLEREQETRAAEARAAANKAADEARLLAQAADPARLDDAEVVEGVVQDAKAAERTARLEETSRARVGGGDYRATLLRDNWVANLTDGDAALAHYWKMRRGDLEAFLATLAAQDVKAGKRDIPGFLVENQKRAA